MDLNAQLQGQPIHVPYLFWFLFARVSGDRALSRAWRQWRGLLGPYEESDHQLFIDDSDDF